MAATWFSPPTACVDCSICRRRLRNRKSECAGNAASSKSKQRQQLSQGFHGQTDDIADRPVDNPHVRILGPLNRVSARTTFPLARVEIALDVGVAQAMKDN